MCCSVLNQICSTYCLRKIATSLGYGFKMRLVVDHVQFKCNTICVSLWGCVEYHFTGNEMMVIDQLPVTIHVMVIKFVYI